MVRHIIVVGAFLSVLALLCGAMVGGCMVAQATLGNYSAASVATQAAIYFAGLVLAGAFTAWWPESRLARWTD